MPPEYLFRVPGYGAKQIVHLAHPCSTTNNQLPAAQVRDRHFAVILFIGGAFGICCVLTLSRCARAAVGCTGAGVIGTATSMLGGFALLVGDGVGGVVVVVGLPGTLERSRIGDTTKSWSVQCQPIL